MLNFDVLVLGGGSAGLAAAVTAARTGAKTLLIERDQTLGGMASTALVHSICGLYFLREDPAALFAHSGFPEEFVRRLVSNGGAGRPTRMGRLDVLLHHPPIFAETAHSFASQEGDLSTLLGFSVKGATRTGDGFAIDLQSSSTLQQVHSRVVVDTSGDGAMAPLLSLDSEITEPHRLQRPAFIFALGNVDGKFIDGESRMLLAQQIARAVQCKKLERGVLGAHFRVGHKIGEVFITIDLAAGADYLPTDQLTLDSLMMEGQAIASQLLGFLQETQPAFSKSVFSMLPERLGVRESRRVKGEAYITQDDVLLGRQDVDVVALNTWPIELREKNTGPKWRYPVEGRPTQIPLGALRPHGQRRLWMAGRCVSAEHEAQAALRVIGTCLATGQAAGAAAAFEALHDRMPAADDVRACTQFAPGP